MSALSEYSPVEWRITKICMLLVCLPFIFQGLFRYHDQPFPLGICNYLPCNFFTVFPVNYILLAAIITASVLYIAEKRMILALSVLSFSSFIIFSLELSNGFFHRKEILTAILMAQLAAYLASHWKPDFNIAKFRMHFSLQVIAGAYLLASISKIAEAGINWVIDSPNIAVQIIKAHNFRYYSTGDISYLEKGAEKASFILEHPTLIIIVMGISLLMECGVFLILKNKKYAFIYGLLLIVMHVGIYFLMSVVIANFVLMVLIFLINPVYLVYRLITPKNRMTVSNTQ